MCYGHCVMHEASVNLCWLLNQLYTHILTSHAHRRVVLYVCNANRSLDTLRYAWNMICCNTLLRFCSCCSGESSIFTTRMTIGVVLALAGFCLYSHCKMSMQRRPAAPVIKGVPDSTDPGFRLGTSQLGKSYGRKSALNIQRPTLL